MTFSELEENPQTMDEAIPADRAAYLTIHDLRQWEGFKRFFDGQSANAKERIMETIAANFAAQCFKDNE